MRLFARARGRLPGRAWKARPGVEISVDMRINGLTLSVWQSPGAYLRIWALLRFWADSYPTAESSVRVARDASTAATSDLAKP